MGEVPDLRLYLPQPERWSAHIKQNWEKEYCFQKNPGEEFFHLLMHGEIYLEHDEERYCPRCAMRRGILTQARLNWQKGK